MINVRDSSKLSTAKCSLGRFRFCSRLLDSLNELFCRDIHAKIHGVKTCTPEQCDNDVLPYIVDVSLDRSDHHFTFCGRTCLDTGQQRIESYHDLFEDVC